MRTILLTLEMPFANKFEDKQQTILQTFWSVFCGHIWGINADHFMNVLKCILRTHSRTKCKPFSNKLSNVLWTCLRTKWGAFLDKFSHILQTHLSTKCGPFHGHFEVYFEDTFEDKIQTIFGHVKPCFAGTFWGLNGDDLGTRLGMFW